MSLRAQRSSLNRPAGQLLPKPAVPGCHPLGGHDTEVEPARAHGRVAVLCFREYARLNFPEEWPPERRGEVYTQYPEPPAPKKRARKPQAKKASHKKTKAGGSKESKSRRRGTTA